MASQIIEASENMIGANHPTLADTLNRALLIEHNNDGTHKTLPELTVSGTTTLASTTSIGSVSSTEIGYLDGVTSAIQTQINTKAPANNTSLTGTTSVESMVLTAGSIDTTPLATDSSTKIANMAAVQAAITNVTAGDIAVVPGDSGKFLTNDGSAVSWAMTSIIRSARTSNTILSAADANTLIDITSGTFTQTFTAAATLGNGWTCYIRNSGTGDITLDPDGSELVDGLTSYIMYPGECRLITCTGTAFVTVVLTPFSRTILTTLNPFVTPPGYAQFGGLLWGGGGGGGNNLADCYAGGGGGGACVPFNLTAAQMSTSQTITIAAGGSGTTASQGTGLVGGTSSIGTLVSSYGGGGGYGSAGASGGSYRNGSGGGALSAGNPGTNAVDAVGGRPSTSNLVDMVDNSGFGGAKSTGNAAYGGAGGIGSSLYGGAGGGAVNATNALVAAGTSVFGGNGGAAGVAVSGTDGTQPGGGGGATHTGTTSGVGGAGQCIIWGIV